MEIARILPWIGVSVFLGCQDRSVDTTQQIGPTNQTAPTDLTPPESVKKLVRQGAPLVDARNTRTYPTVWIGSQRWMARNLDFDTVDRTLSWCPANDTSLCRSQGRLYSWRIAMRSDSTVKFLCDVFLDSTGICPAGWHLPSLAEWREMVDSLGEPDSAGDALKANSGWRLRRDGSSGSGVDRVGFSAIPAGYRFSGEQGYGSFGHTPQETSFLDHGQSAAMWTRTNDLLGSCWSAWGVFLTADQSAVEYSPLPRSSGLSVRCVENRPATN